MRSSTVRNPSRRSAGPLPRRTAPPLTRPAHEGDPGCFGWVLPEWEQPCGSFIEKNPPWWRQSTHLFPQFQFGLVWFSACVNQKTNRPMACTYLLFLLHDLYYMYVCPF